MILARKIKFMIFTFPKIDTCFVRYVAQSRCILFDNIFQLFRFWVGEKEKLIPRILQVSKVVEVGKRIWICDESNGEFVMILVLLGLILKVGKRRERINDVKACVERLFISQEKYDVIGILC